MRLDSVLPYLPLTSKTVKHWSGELFVENKFKSLPPWSLLLSNILSNILNTWHTNSIHLGFLRPFSRIDQLFQVFLNCLKGITGNNTFQCNNDLFIMNRDKLTTNYSHLCQCSGRFMTRFQDQNGPTADLDQCAAQLRRTLTSPWFPNALL